MFESTEAVKTDIPKRYIQHISSTGGLFNLAASYNLTRDFPERRNRLAELQGVKQERGLVSMYRCAGVCLCTLVAA